MTNALPRTSPESSAGFSGSAIPQRGASDALDLEALRVRCEQLGQQVIQAQRLALLGDLALVIAHEFNNLLTPVVMRADSALLGGSAAEMRQALEQVITNVQRAIAFSARVLSLGKPLAPGGSAADADRGAADATPPREGECDAAEAVQAALSALARSLEKTGIEVSCQAPPGLRVRLPSELFAQVVLNLLLQARDRLHGQRGRITLTVERAGACVGVTVRDSSRTLATPAAREALSAFFSATAPQPLDWQTVGLGLQVCRLIASLFGGRMEVVPGANGAGAVGLRALFPAAPTPTGQPD